MAQENLSFQCSELDLLAEIKRIYCVNDIIINEHNELNSIINKLALKLKINIINSEVSALSEKIKRIIEKSKGSLELQKLLPELTTSMCDMLYDAVSYYRLLINNLS